MSSFDQVIRNILADIFAEEQQEETVRPRARPSGLGAPTTSVRPRARPEDLEPAKPTATETTTNFINEMANYDDSSDEGVEIPLADLKTDARSLEGKFKTTATDLARLNRNSRGSKVRVKSVVPDDELDSIMSEVKTVLSASPATRKPMQFADLETQQLLYDVEKSVLSPRTQTRNPVLDASTAPEFTPRDFELTTKDIQDMLSTKGYDVGKIDGVMGPRTEAAIKQFQKDNDLKVDGKVGPKTRAAMEATQYDVAVSELSPEDIYSTPDALTVSGNIKKSKEEKLDVQRALLELGYDVGAIDGIIGTKTRAAIRQFQKDQGLKADAIVGENTAAAMNAALSGRQSVDVGDQEVQVIKSSILPDLSMPSHMKMFIQDLTGYDLETAQTEDFFSAAEKDVIKALVVNSSKRLGNKKRGAVEYGNANNPKDYTIGIEDVTWDSSNVDSLSFNDAEGAIKKTLGQFSWKINKEGDLIVTDRYNFNDAADLQAQYPTHTDRLKHLSQLAAGVATGDTSTFGWLRRLGALYGSVEGEGAEFRINLGKIDL